MKLLKFSPSLHLRLPASNLDSDFSRIIWPSGCLLAMYIYLHPDICHRLHCLELGAGIALPSLMCLKLGANRVILQEREALPEFESHIASSIALNELNATQTKFVSFNWGDVDTIQRRLQGEKIDVILAADCLYDEADFESFIVTIASILVDNPTATVYLAHQIRSTFATIIPELILWEIDAQEVDFSSQFQSKMIQVFGPILPSIEEYLPALHLYKLTLKPTALLE